MMGDVNTRDLFLYARQTGLAVDYFSRKMGFTVGQSQLKKKIDAGDTDFQVIDTRSEGGYRKAHIPGAIWVDADCIEEHLHKFDKNKVNIVYCYGSLCLRGPRVCLQAAQAGYPVMELHGNFDGWAQDYAFPTEGESRVS
jgi:rhodanese-related sulfurtransferase